MEHHGIRGTNEVNDDEGYFGIYRIVLIYGFRYLEGGTGGWGGGGGACLSLQQTFTLTYGALQHTRDDTVNDDGAFFRYIKRAQQTRYQKGSIP